MAESFDDGWQALVPNNLARGASTRAEILRRHPSRQQRQPDTFSDISCCRTADATVYPLFASPVLAQGGLLDEHIFYAASYANANAIYLETKTRYRCSMAGCDLPFPFFCLDQTTSLVRTVFIQSPVLKTSRATILLDRPRVNPIPKHISLNPLWH